ncbi:MAG: carboxypeptidase regulatory-like domain-containing protein [Candidatus Methanofastidiosia archaeon]
MVLRRLRILLASLLLISLVGVYPVFGAPAAPTNLIAVSEEGGDIDLSWDSVSGATSYLIYRGLSPGFTPGTSLAEVSTTQYTDNISGGLVDGFIFYYVVKAKSGEGESDPSNEADAICDATPPPAVPLVSPPDGEYVITNKPTLTWNAVADGVPSGGSDVTGLDHYELQYSYSSDFLPSETTTVSNIPSSNTSHTFVNPLPNDTFYWRVRAHDVAGNVMSWSGAAVRSFIVNMSAPTLLAPADGSAFNGDPASELPPTFSWTEVSGASGYLLEIDTQTPISASPAYSFPVSGGATTSYKPLVEFSDGTYYWRVSATNSEGTSIGIYSSTWSFIVDRVAPSAPTLVSPADSSSTGDTTPEFTWQSVTGATGYKIEIADSSATDPDGSFVDANVVYTYPPSGGTLESTSHTPGTTLLENTYYWHVLALDEAENESLWSVAWSLTIDTSIPTTPVLVSPTNGSTITDSTPTFIWQGVSGATSYKIQYSTSSSFSTGVSENTTSNTTYTVPLSASLANGTYYWRVSSNLDYELYSSAWSFIMDASPSQQPVTFKVYVKAGATGTSIEGAQVSITQSGTNIATGLTDATGMYEFTLPAGTYTISAIKNTWDNGSGSQYSSTLQVASGMSPFYIPLYLSGYDLIVATVKYNDKYSSTPPLIVLYKNNAFYDNVTLPKFPPSLPQNLQLAKTNLVIEVPVGATYAIAYPAYPEGKVTIANLSHTVANASNNNVILQITSSVNGVVVDEGGNIITGAKVTLFRAENNNIVGAVDTTSIGFIFSQLLPDDYYVKVQLSGYADLTTEQFTVEPHSTHNLGTITLQQEKGTLNIAVQSEEGMLISNANVTVTDSDENIVFSELAPQGLATAELPSGNYTVTASVEGYTLVEALEIVVTLGETVSGTVLMKEEVEPPPEKGNLQISVTDIDGNPIQLIDVFIDGTKVGVTNQDGVLLVLDLDLGTYEIKLVKEGYEEVTMSEEVVAGDTVTVSKQMTIIETGGTSKLKWILIAAAVIIVFAIVLSIATKRKGPAGGEEKEKRAPPSVQGKPKAHPKTGLPSTSRTKVISEKRYKGGGIPERSVK